MRDNETIFPPVRDAPMEPWVARPAPPSTRIRLPETEFGDDDYQRMNEALAVLRYLFPNCDITIQSRFVPVESRTAQEPEKQPNRSNRDKVLGVTKAAPATVDGIAKVTGLDTKKIRGVLTAPDLKFNRQRIGKVVSYEFVGMRERKRTKSAKRTASANGEP